MSLSLNHTIGLTTPLQSLLASLVQALIARLGRDQRPASARLVVPRHRSLHTGKAIHMPTNILSDVTTVVPVEFDNLGGLPVPSPASLTATANNDNAAAVTATAEQAADGTWDLVLSPVQPAQLNAIANCGLTFTSPDGSQIVTPNVDFSVTNDVAAANAHLDTAHMTTRPLPAA